MVAFWKRFFWGAPSHRRIAWPAAFAGLVVIFLTSSSSKRVFGADAKPLFLLAVVCIGLAESGWAIELLPRRYTTLAGWGRVVRWLCALLGLVLSVLSILTNAAPWWFTVSFTLVGAGLAVEMSPSGDANRAKRPPRYRAPETTNTSDAL